MKKPTLFQALSRRQKGALLSMAMVVPLLAAISCATVKKQAVLLPDVPGATYVGSAECETCHDEITRDFQTADHARLIAQGPNGLKAGCESCHGPASLHTESGGEIKPPFMFTSGRPRPAGVTGRLADSSARSGEGVCFQCHNDVRGQFSVPHHHPVPEGKMSCWECHPPHKGNAFASGSTRLHDLNQGCMECHPAQRGPFAFEHPAMDQGCTACHSPHGSINDKMLTERNSTLCMKCHFQQIRPGGAILIGGSDHTLRVQRGTCWSAGCHEAVHGSRVNSSLRF